MRIELKWSDDLELYFRGECVFDWPDIRFIKEEEVKVNEEPPPSKNVYRTKAALRRLTYAEQEEAPPPDNLIPDAQFWLQRVVKEVPTLEAPAKAFALRARSGIVLGVPIRQFVQELNTDLETFYALKYRLEKAGFLQTRKTTSTNVYFLIFPEEVKKLVVKEPTTMERGGAFKKWLNVILKEPHLNKKDRTLAMFFYEFANEETLTITGYSKVDLSELCQKATGDFYNYAHITSAVNKFVDKGYIKVEHPSDHQSPLIYTLILKQDVTKPPHRRKSKNV
jgi:hypothetical protein